MKARFAPLFWALLLGLLGSVSLPSIGYARPDRVIVGQDAPPPPGVYEPGPPPPIPPRLLKAPLRRPVEIRMMVIHATNSVKGYDPAIAPLRQHLSVLNYQGFRLLFRNDMLLQAKTTRSVGLFDGKVIEVTLNSATWEKVVLRIRMYNPNQPDGVTLDTTVSVARRGTFFVGGPKYKDGALLLPITAWY